MFGANYQLKELKKLVGTLKKFDENVKYFFETVAKNPKYFGKFVIVGNKRIKGLFDNENLFWKAGIQFDESDYAGNVPKQNEIWIY